VAAIGALVLVPATFCLAIQFPPPKQRSERASPAPILALLRDPIFLFAGLALAIQSGMEGMSNDWMTRYFRNVTLFGRDSAEWQTQLGLVAVTGAMLLTRLALAALLKRASSRLVLFVSIAVAACGEVTLFNATNYATSLTAALLIGIGLAAAFPVVLGYVGDRYPEQSGTAFSTIFVIALIGNMTINKTFGYIAQIHGIQQYAKVMLVLLACSSIFLMLVVRQLGKNNPLSEENGLSART
jgi:MFS family permease